MALEFDDFGNAARWSSFEQAMRAAGVSPGVWFTNGYMLPFAPPGADFCIAECESDEDYNGIVGSLGQLNPGQRHAVITNFGGLLVRKVPGDPKSEVDVEATKARCKPIIDAGFFCQYEAYFYTEPDNTNADHCGWPSEMVAPVLGVGFNGRSLESQEALHVPGYGIYLAEYLK